MAVLYSPAAVALLSLLSLVQVPPATGPASEEEDAGSQKAARIEKAKDAAKEFDDRNRLELGSEDNYLLRPALLASKKDRTVRLRGYAVGLKGSAAIEFFLIGPESGKGYESLAVSLAKPSDIDAALKFIGLAPGQPVDYLKNRTWPKGPRVNMTFIWDERSPDGNVSQRKVRAEEMLLVRAQEGQAPALPSAGLVYVGGVWVDAEEGAQAGSPKRFLADITDPGSIASNYNETTTLLDLPAQARQSAVYSSRVVNPANALMSGQPIEILLEPDAKADAPSRVVDLTVKADGAGDAALKDLKLQAVETSDPKSNPAAPGTLPQLLATFKTFLDAGREPFVSLEPADTLPLGTVAEFYKLMSSIEGERGIRLEPALPGHLYYEALLPDERLRDYKKRIWQPYELHLTGAGPDAQASFREFTEAEGAAADAKFTFKDLPVTAAADLQKLLADRAEERRPLVIFASKALPYSVLRKWTSPLLSDAAKKDVSPVIWVYLEDGK